MMTYHTTGHSKSKGTSLRILEEIGEKVFNGRKYKLLVVSTLDGNSYLCIRLYNQKGKFIKQFLFELQIADWLIETLQEYFGALEILEHERFLRGLPR